VPDALAAHDDDDPGDLVGRHAGQELAGDGVDRRVPRSVPGLHPPPAPRQTNTEHI